MDELIKLNKKKDNGILQSLFATYNDILLQNKYYIFSFIKSLFK
jgi:hypothetical protein